MCVLVAGVAMVSVGVGRDPSLPDVVGAVGAGMFAMLPG